MLDDSVSRPSSTGRWTATDGHRGRHRRWTANRLRLPVRVVVRHAQVRYSRPVCGRKPWWDATPSRRVTAAAGHKPQLFRVRAVRIAEASDSMPRSEQSSAAALTMSGWTVRFADRSRGRDQRWSTYYVRRKSYPIAYPLHRTPVIYFIFYFFF